MTNFQFSFECRVCFSVNMMLWRKAAAAIVSAILVTNTVGQDEVVVEQMGKTYCTEANKAVFLSEESYDEVFKTCDDGKNNYYEKDVDYTAIRECIDEGANDLPTETSDECRECWVKLVGGFFTLAPTQQTACIADPTSTECVYGDVYGYLANFEICSGFIPFAYPEPTPNYSGTDLTPTRFALLAILPILLLIQ